MNITFKNPIATGFNPDLQNIQFWDIASNTTLPPGKFFVMGKGNVLTYQQMFDKGATHISRLEMPWSDLNAVIAMNYAGKGYTDVPRNREIWEQTAAPGVDENTYTLWSQGGVSQYMSNAWWPNGPYSEEQARAKGRSVGLASYAFHVGEATENTEWAIADWPMWGYFYNEYVPRVRNNFEPRGIPWRVAHDYLVIGLPDQYYLGRLSKAAQKAAFNAPYSAWPFTQYSPGGTLNETTAIMVTVYPGEPWADSKVVSVFYQMECYRKMGKSPGIVASNKHEWRPNNFAAIKFTDGKVYRSDKVDCDPAACITYGCGAFIHGDNFILWGGRKKVSDITKLDLPYSFSGTSDYWLPDGSSNYQLNAFPRYTLSGTGTTGFAGVEDMFAFGMKMYSETFALTEGGTRAFLKYRIRTVGGTWSDFIEVSNVGMDDMSDAWHESRGYVFSQMKDNMLSVYWLWEKADGIKREIEFIHPTNPSISYNAFVAGNCMHAQTINL